MIKRISDYLKPSKSEDYIASEDLSHIECDNDGLRQRKRMRTTIDQDFVVEMSELKYASMVHDFNKGRINFSAQTTIALISDTPGCTKSAAELDDDCNPSVLDANNGEVSNAQFFHK